MDFMKVFTEYMSKEMKEVFCITHFFNPVRYMRLLELVIGSQNERGTEHAQCQTTQHQRNQHQARLQYFQSFYCGFQKEIWDDSQKIFNVCIFVKKCR